MALQRFRNKKKWIEFSIHFSNSCGCLNKRLLVSWVLDHLCYQIKDISLVKKIGEVKKSVSIPRKCHRSFTTQVGKARVVGKAQMGMHRALEKFFGIEIVASKRPPLRIKIYHDSI